ncbi:MAG: hypothetical protein A2504_16505 [Bdellovibrionales bacterium RIFOXYD12_FULL_39_22]|nr:MAG: hypothetical protein A2385_13770 [Bdellovibrionales bacterium RIFOXYB1_FULL_39_21]OFZ47190.1 MAG: hypothetical protein A2404_02220 [Bdellovibrionales bacterium RIFOXYC1_FULL_39_130]OFZ75029.1 MAG: hypothetical protein A2560_07830 [Bdellovibrionales bacterium RIFOXYD1_FULL_39_84]OFZ94713.1 MAG: hypothetical protein A2504_16505 [Bdellovibrionales bacterium RIFOXYD12_FULL_39_22]
MKEKRKRISDTVKHQAVDDYISGARTANEIAEELNVAPQTIYAWRTSLAEKTKGIRVDELMASGNPKEQTKKIVQLEDEVAEYQKKVAEQAISKQLS